MDEATRRIASARELLRALADSYQQAHEQKRLAAWAKAAHSIIELLADEDGVLEVKQHEVTALLVAHRDMIEAQLRDDRAAEVEAVARMAQHRAAIADGVGGTITGVDAPTKDSDLCREPGCNKPPISPVNAWCREHDRNGGFQHA